MLAKKHGVCGVILSLHQKRSGSSFARGLPSFAREWDCYAAMQIGYHVLSVIL